MQLRYCWVLQGKEGERSGIAILVQEMGENKKDNGCCFFWKTRVPMLTDLQRNALVHFHRQLLLVMLA